MVGQGCKARRAQRRAHLQWNKSDDQGSASTSNLTEEKLPWNKDQRRGSTASTTSSLSDERRLSNSPSMSDFEEWLEANPLDACVVVRNTFIDIDEPLPCSRPRRHTDPCGSQSVSDDDEDWMSRAQSLC